METLKIGIQQGDDRLISTNFLKAVRANNSFVEVLFSREEYIPEHVESGLVDVGIIGESIFLETKKFVDVIESPNSGIRVLPAIGPSYPIYGISSNDNQMEILDLEEVIIVNKFLSKEKRDILDKLLAETSIFLEKQFWAEFPEVSH